MKRLIPVLALLVVLIAAVLFFVLRRPGGGTATASSGPATDQALTNPNPADWPMYRRTYDGSGYSPLNQITKDNVNELQFAWSTNLGPGAVQVTPIAYQGVVYLPHPDDTVQAFNAKTGDRLWEYKRQLPEDIDQATFSLPRTVRNIAVYGDKIYHASSDGYIVALEAATGKLAWETQVADYKLIRQVAGPIIVKGKVISGRACNAQASDGCFITAHDAKTGSEVWKRSLVPKAGENGENTWGSTPAEKRVQAGAWMVGSYDPELDMIFFGTSVPLPLAESARGSGDGDALYTNSTLALKPDTGEIAWSFQHLPRDNWGLDHVFERMVVTAEVSPDSSAVKWISPKVTAGESRKVITGVPGKTGVVWTLDAKTGEFLWARETVPQNVISGINPETGRPTLNAQVMPKEGSPTQVCPSSLGGKGWSASAYNPDSKVMFVPLSNACMEISISGSELSTKFKPSSSEPENVGVLEAISASTGKTLWRLAQPAAFSSAMATASGLLFVGDINRRFRALDQETGKVIWETALSSPVTGTPISYSVENKQYVAVALGGGTDLEKILELTPKLRPGVGGSALFVFSLPDPQQ